MSTIDRLKRLTRENPANAEGRPSNKPELAELRRRIDAIMAKKPQPPSGHFIRPQKASIPLEQALSGEIVKNPYGQFLFCRGRFRGDSFHGSLPVKDCLKIDMPSASLLAGHREISGFSPHDALFFDTETTGLAGGTGTFPFLIGLGWFEGEDFIACQIFARDFSDEKAMLSFLNETAQEKRFLVSFNGRAFDLNLLSARFVLNRLENRLQPMPHLDLLNPSRRLLSHRTTNCRLVTLEDEVLGFRRTGDIPGAEIPQRYFDWLRKRDPYLMEDVFHHNRLDVVSMAALLRHLTQVVSGECMDKVHPGDSLAAARLHKETGNLEMMRVFVDAVISGEAGEYSNEAKMMLSFIHKKNGRWEDAVMLWEDIAAVTPDPVALIELAKYCEHKSHDIGRAIALVGMVLERENLIERERDSLTHRLRRLLTKLRTSEI